MKAGVRSSYADRQHRRAALIAGALIVLSTLVVFVGVNPFADPYEIRAVFSAANRPAIGGDVRIAGVRMGEVASIAAGPGGTSVLTLRIDDRGRPLHADATATIEARLILEGNYFVRISPGTPGAPELSDGATIPLERTAGPVQFDQVLNVFDLPTRDAMHRGFDDLGRGLSGHDGLRLAVRAFDRSLADVGAVARATRGQDAGDLGSALRSSAATTSQLAEDPAALASLVTSFNRVSGALAADDRALSATIRGFDETLRAAPAGLRALDSALPTLTEAGDALRPALQAAPDALRRTSELLDELGPLASSNELPGLLDDLEPATAALPGFQERLTELFPLAEDVTECVRTQVVPTLNMEVPDGATSTGDPAWLDIVHAFTGLTGASPTFDGNGVSTRAGVTQGEASLGNIAPGLGEFVGGGPDIQGVRPTWLGYGVEPPYRPDQPCASQALPDLSLRSGPPPVWQAR